MLFKRRNEMKRNDLENLNGPLPSRSMTTTIIRSANGYNIRICITQSDEEARP